MMTIMMNMLVLMIIMTHPEQRQQSSRRILSITSSHHDNHVHASSASRAVITIRMSTHLLHLQWCLEGHLKRIEDRDADDNHDEHSC